MLFFSFLDYALKISERVSMCERVAGAMWTHSLRTYPQKPRIVGEIVERSPRGLPMEDPLLKPTFPNSTHPTPVCLGFPGRIAQAMRHIADHDFVLGIGPGVRERADSPIQAELN